MKSRQIITLLATQCALLCGCGSSTSAPPAYVAAGNSLCVKELGQLNRLHRPSTPEQALSYLPRALAIMRSETGGLAALHPPASGQHQFAAALTDTRELATVLSSFLHQLRGGIVQFTTFATVQTRSIALTKQLDTRFRQVGLTRCAE
jgi:hypothetical protein